MSPTLSLDDEAISGSVPSQEAADMDVPCEKFLSQEGSPRSDDEETVLPSTLSTSSMASTLSTANFDDVAVPTPRAPRRQLTSTFVCSKAELRDAPALKELYEKDYLEKHRNIHTGPAGEAAKMEWRTALGDVDFRDVIKDIAAAEKKKAGSSTVRLLKCYEVSKPHQIVGYVLFELREKGSKSKKQRYCELVNIVVGEDHQGCGAGRKLFEALLKELEQVAPEKKNDLRLYVAEQNTDPLSWYLRLGFKPSGYQSEKLNSTEVKFMRLIRSEAQGQK